MRIWILCLFILCFQQKVIGQIERIDSNKWYLTFSPSAFINIYPGIQAGIEKNFGESKRLHLDIAYLNDLNFYNDDRNFNGLRLKGGITWFTERPIKHEDYARFFAQLNFIFRYTVEPKTEDFQRFEGAFFQRIDFNEKRYLLGPAVGGGLETKLHDSFYFQAGISAGIGNYRVSFDNVPDDAELVENFNFFRNRRKGNYLFPILSLSLKFILVL